ncbi:MAG: DNA-directed RNA polymerase subunit alpha [Oscillospiraceae bacterium]|jgi:DNA-directed RNA polymerase subunit alpha|nr:DNA-directed RNA polymerase subunit alpha [Oscillospiraceae bacterium]
MIGSETPIPKIEVLESAEEQNYAKFVVEPLDRGYGNTLGNSLRRVLLSSLEGSAITSVQVDGVLHEFSTIPNVTEDLTEIVLNLKGVVLNVLTEDEKTVFITKNGPAIVTAEDIQADGEVQIVNPGHHIATLDEGAVLSMRLTCDRGLSYVSAEKNKERLKPAIGVIAIDSIYTPVLKTNYFVENTRVGQITDYDRLVLEVWTNGTISPSDAVAQASKILRDRLALFTRLGGDAFSTDGLSDARNLAEDQRNSITIDDLELSIRASNSLKRAGINNLGGLLSWSEPELKKIRNFGEKTLQEVIDKLHELGLDLAPGQD